MQPLRRIPVLICALLAAFFALPPYSLSASASKSKSVASKSSKSKAPSAKSKSSGSKSASAKGKSGSKSKQARSSRPQSQRAPEPARIQEIQQALAQRGYSCEPSGVMDSATVEALKRFQEDQNINNLTGRGKLDSLTLIALGLGPQRGNQPSAQGPSQPPTPPGQPEGRNQ